MKTIFHQPTRQDLIFRVQTLQESSVRQWGKMGICQMVKHNTVWNDWILGTDKTFQYKQAFIGVVFGKLALKGTVNNDRPMKKNMPAGMLAVRGHVEDFEHHKNKWIGQILAYENFSNPRFVHDFFGRMSRDQIGILAYKHMDHHLRQFGS